MRWEMSREEMKKRRARRALKGGAGRMAPLRRNLPGLILLLAVTLAACWVLVPFLIFALTAAKECTPDLPGAVLGYAGSHLLDGWRVVELLAGWEALACILIFMAFCGAAVIGAQLVMRGMASKTVRNIFGPAAERSNAKGSARLYCDEALINAIENTWGGKWDDAPGYAAPVMGWLPSYRRYVLQPDECHSVTFGVTGAGKTTKVNYASIDSICAAGASLIAMDPKGELYNAVSRDLREKGMDVYILDFRETQRSNNLNPMDQISGVFKRHRERYRGHVRAAQRVIEEERGRGALSKGDPMERSCWKDAEAYGRYAALMRRAEHEYTLSWSRSFEAAQDLAMAVIPERPDAGSAKHWEDVARLVLEALSHFVGTYVPEDFISDGGRPAMPQIADEQRTLETVRALLGRYGGIVKGRKQLEELFDHLDPQHPASVAFDQARTAEEREYSTAIAETIKFLDAMLSMSVNEIMTSSDFGLEQFGERQTALFVVLPDERPGVGRAFTLIVSQLYQALVRCAKRHGGAMPVRTCFLLEEFGNIKVPIPDFQNKLMMARGYNIFFHMTLQGLNQLTETYGREPSKAIISACNVQVLLKTNDAEGCGRYFSERMGKYTYVTSQVSRSRRALGLMDESASVSRQEGERWLMNPDEITKWDMDWGAIVLSASPGRKPSPLAAALYGYKTIQPMVIPLEAAWETPTAVNLGIGGKERMREKARACEAEDRLETRKRALPWTPAPKGAARLAEERRMGMPGGVSARAMRAASRTVASEQVLPAARNFLRERLDADRIAGPGADAYIDEIAAQLRREVELRAAASEDEPESEIARHRVRAAAAAASGYALTELTGCLVTGRLPDWMGQEAERTELQLERPLDAGAPRQGRPCGHADAGRLDSGAAWEGLSDADVAMRLRECAQRRLAQADGFARFVELLGKDGIEYRMANNGILSVAARRGCELPASRAGIDFTLSALEARWGKPARACAGKPACERAAEGPGGPDGRACGSKPRDWSMEDGRRGEFCDGLRRLVRRRMAQADSFAQFAQLLAQEDGVEYRTAGEGAFVVLGRRDCKVVAGRLDAAFAPARLMHRWDGPERAGAADEMAPSEGLRRRKGQEMSPFASRTRRAFKSRASNLEEVEARMGEAGIGWDWVLAHCDDALGDDPGARDFIRVEAIAGWLADRRGITVDLRPRGDQGDFGMEGAGGCDGDLGNGKEG